MRVRTGNFVTIKPALRDDGQPKRVPMPGRYGLPHGSPLPQAGWKVAEDEFVRRLLQDRDVVKVDDPAAPAKPAATTTSAGGAA